MQVSIPNQEKSISKDKKTILREKNKEGKERGVEVRKTEEEGLLREVTKKIGLERIDT